MTLLSLNDLKKHFAAHEVLLGASLKIDPGQKVGLVGRNGTGKTTLIRLITGEDQPDWGTVTLRKGSRLGHVPQRPQFEPGVTVRAFVESGLADLHAMVAEWEALSARMGEVEGDELDKAIKMHGSLGERIESMGGWETGRRVETVLSGIGLAPELWEREARTLSGGEKSRTALARVLTGGFDLLLLDEPTNHLDLAGIEWIEEYIRNLDSALLVVSHDRRLLDNVVKSIVELERGKLVSYPGNYTRYMQLKAERYESDLRAFEQQRDLLRREDLFIKKHMGSQRTAEAKGRAKKLSHIERLERPFHDVRHPVIPSPETKRSGELVLEGDDLTGGYDGNICFENVRVRVGRGERIGIVGTNGAGKSTLLRILAGRQTPLAGKVASGHGAQCGYFDQETSHLVDDRTPLSEIKIDKPHFTELQARSWLARFLFRGKDVEKSVGTLSGGERARLSLAKLILEEPTWLAMDEPTNHLDLAGRTAMEEMLGGFQGAILAVSHDRAFLDGICNHILEVSDGKVREYSGGYEDYHRAKLAEVDAERSRRDQARNTEAATAKRKLEAEAKAKAKAKTAASKGKKSGGQVRNPYRFKKLEQEIERLEEERTGLNSELAKEEVYRDPNRLRDAQMRSAEIERDLERAYAEWESWS